MAPRPLDLSPFRDEIEQWIGNGVLRRDVLDLLSNRGIDCSLATLKRNLQNWEIQTIVSTNQADPRTEVLIQSIRAIYMRNFHNDTVISTILNSQGFKTSSRQVKRIRIEHGWKRKSTSEEEQNRSWNKTYELCWDAVINGPARNYGRVLMQAYVRTEYGHDARQDHCQTALKKINEELGRQRLPHMKPVHRHEAIYQGADHIWSIDGHEKFSNYGIEIYGCIDAYSRRIIWFYVGVSNRTQISIAKQYLETVAKLDKCPQFIRSDRGIETPMVADIHYAFYRESQQLLHSLNDEEKDALRFTDCYKYGKSTTNQRIESLWQRMISSQTKPWIELFRYLTEEGLYDSANESDQVVLLFIFLNLLRCELFQFTTLHNAHRIRKDNKRSHHIPGIPDQIYDDLDEDIVPRAEAQNYSFKPDLDLLDEMLACVRDFDLDLHITRPSFNWCEEKLQQLHPNPPPKANEFIKQIPERRLETPQWYRELILAARAYRPQSLAHRLAVAPKPRDGYGWFNRPEAVAAARERDIDTWGEDQAATAHYEDDYHTIGPIENRRSVNGDNDGNTDSSESIFLSDIEFS